MFLFMRMRTHTVAKLQTVFFAAALSAALRRFLPTATHIGERVKPRTHDAHLPTTAVKYGPVTQFHIMIEEINMDYELLKYISAFSFHWALWTYFLKYNKHGVNSISCLENIIEKPIGLKINIFKILRR